MGRPREAMPELDPLAARAFRDALRDIFEEEGCVELLLDDEEAPPWQWDGAVHASA
jgi:hypothetical protein